MTATLAMSTLATMDMHIRREYRFRRESRRTRNAKQTSDIHASTQWAPIPASTPPTQQFNLDEFPHLNLPLAHQRYKHLCTNVLRRPHGLRGPDAASPSDRRQPSRPASTRPPKHPPPHNPSAPQVIIRGSSASSVSAGPRHPRDGDGVYRGS